MLIAEGIADCGRRILADAGIAVVLPNDAYDLRTVVALIVRSVFRVDAAVLVRFPNVRVVAKLGTGLDNIDASACAAAGVQVCSVPGMNAVSTAEFMVMQILALWKNAYEIRDRVRARDYRRATYHGHEIAGATAGIIGYGSVGKHVVERLQPFVREVLVYDRTQESRETIAFGNVRFMPTVDALLPVSDILILAVTLAGNERMVDVAFLAQVRADVLLVNVARGGLVDEAALCDFLRRNPEAHYVTDVLANEPDYTLSTEQQEYRNPLLELPNVTYSPHIAALTLECQDRIAAAIAEQVIAALSPSVVTTQQVRMRTVL